MWPATRFPALFLLLLTISCGGAATRTGADPAPGEQPTVRIENRASLDMDIHLVRSDGRTIRLGFVPGGETATFPLPATITAGTTSISFQARPFRRSGQTITSEPFGVIMGEQITWSISPQ